MPHLPFFVREMPFNYDFGLPSFSKYQKLTQFLPFIMASYADEHNTLSLPEFPSRKTRHKWRKRFLVN